MNDIFSGIFDSDMTQVISINDFMLCLCSALIAGAVLALVASRTRASKSFITTLAVLPAVVAMVIMMVNGNIGTGLAVAGTFGLVRFRSAPGSAREITMLFLAAVCGMMIGTGYIAYAFLFMAVMSVFTLIYEKLDFDGVSARYKTLSVTIPEDLDYSGVFDDIFEKYASSCRLTRVKSTNMGSMFKLNYDVVLKDASREKEMLDMIRTRNGNLEINVSRQATGATEL